MGEWGGEAVIETGHRVALLLSSKSNSKGKRKAPFDSDMVCCLRRCQEARDQTQLATVQSGAQLSLAKATPPSAANASGALRFPFGKRETEGAQSGAEAGRSPRTFVLQAPQQAFPGNRRAWFHSFARMQAHFILGWALMKLQDTHTLPATGREEEEEEEPGPAEQRCVHSGILWA